MREGGKRREREGNERIGRRNTSKDFTAKDTLK